MGKRILVMNFGSTSTKVAIYEGDKEIVRETISHPMDELKQFKEIDDQLPYRRKALDAFLEKNGRTYSDFDCIINRGANCRPVPSGIYEISQQILDDIATGRWGFHPARIGVRLSYQIGQEYGIPAIFADPPISDEFWPLARYAGIKELKRISSLHVLNHKAIAKRYARNIGRDYESLNLIVVHMGGGISVGAHTEGRIVDANNALDGDGPFSPERAGTLPNSDLIKMCYSGNYTLPEMLKKMTGGGGLMSYLGTSNALEVEKMIESGDKYAEEVYAAMAYQVAKEIGAAACVLAGKVDAIIYTASLAFSESFTGMVTERVDWIAPVVKMPGEDEILSLAENALRYLNGEAAKDYAAVCQKD
ncbi:butyrate kinase [Ruminococcaceae bacterium OttesenSCG-928-D13]|nr:butyrate kinase [Ruminococcaceae bacterium OttesenSCG-928-D13]